jgi:tetratricopeptide (TPR) repeat protein
MKFAKEHLKNLVQEEIGLFEDDLFEEEDLFEDELFEDELYEESPWGKPDVPVEELREEDDDGWFGEGELYEKRSRLLKSKLQQIIKEEINAVLSEQRGAERIQGLGTGAFQSTAHPIGLGKRERRGTEPIASLADVPAAETVEPNPAEAGRYTILGHKSFKNKRFKLAVKYYEKALTFNPKNIWLPKFIKKAQDAIPAVPDIPIPSDESVANKWVGWSWRQVWNALGDELGKKPTKDWYVGLPYKHPARVKYRAWYRSRGKK